MKKKTIFLMFLLMPAVVLSQFSVRIQHKEKSHLITWNKFEGNLELLVGYKIYLNEGYMANGFPTTQIDSLGKTVLGWESQQRKTYNFGGINIRKLDQWGNKKVITPGFCYTIGIERIIKNSITMTDSSEKAICYILPFEFLPLSKYLIQENKTIHPSKFYILPAPIKTFIRVYGGKVYFSFNGKNKEIENIVEHHDYFVFKLKDQIVKYDKPPHRPEAYGNPKIIIQSLGLIILFFIVTLVLVWLYITIKALIILNYISHHRNDVNVFLTEILEKEIFSVLIIYSLVLFTNDSFISRLFNFILKKITLIDTNMFQDRFQIIDKLAHIFDENSLFQYKKIKLEILNNL